MDKKHSQKNQTLWDPYCAECSAQQMQDSVSNKVESNMVTTKGCPLTSTHTTLAHGPDLHT